MLGEAVLTPTTLTSSILSTSMLTSSLLVLSSSFLDLTTWLEKEYNGEVALISGVFGSSFLISSFFTSSVFSRGTGSGRFSSWAVDLMWRKAQESPFLQPFPVSGLKKSHLLLIFFFGFSYRNENTK